MTGSREAAGRAVTYSFSPPRSLSGRPPESVQPRGAARLYLPLQLYARRQSCHPPRCIRLANTMTPTSSYSGPRRTRPRHFLGGVREPSPRAGIPSHADGRRSPACAGCAVALIPLAVAGAGNSAADAAVALAAMAAWSYVGVCAVVCVVAPHPPSADAPASGAHAAPSMPTTRRTSTSATSSPARSPPPAFPPGSAACPATRCSTFSPRKAAGDPAAAAGHDGLRIVHLTDLHMSGRITQGVLRGGRRASERHRSRTWSPSPATWSSATSASTGFPTRSAGCGRPAACTTCSATTTAGRRQRGSSGAGRRRADPRRRHAGEQVTVRDTPIISPATNSLVRPGRRSARHARRTTRAACRCELLLAHSPDQFAWAQAHDFDLMLAGHNHGGQIRLPLSGAILAPSLHGVRYAAAHSAAATPCCTSAAAPAASRPSAGTARRRSRCLC